MPAGIGHAPARVLRDAGALPAPRGSDVDGNFRKSEFQIFQKTVGIPKNEEIFQKMRGHSKKNESTKHPRYRFLLTLPGVARAVRRLSRAMRAIGFWGQFFPENLEWSKFPKSRKWPLIFWKISQFFGIWISGAKPPPRQFATAGQCAAKHEVALVAVSSCASAISGVSRVMRIFLEIPKNENGFRKIPKNVGFPKNGPHAEWFH